MLGWGTIVRQRRRAFFTMLAIAIGIAAVITINAAGAGIHSFVLGQLDSFGPDSLEIDTRVPVGKKSTFGNGIGEVGITVTTLKDADLKTVLKQPNIIAAYGFVADQEAVSYQGQIKKVMVAGEGYQMPLIDQVSFTEGGFYDQNQEESLDQVAVLGSKAKEKLFGDDTAVGKNIYIRGKPFRVVGVFAPRGVVFFFDFDNLIVVPTKSLQKKLLGTDYFQSIIARMKSGAPHASTVDELAAEIRINHDISDPSKDDFIINTTADAANTLSTITGGITLLLIALVCISLLVGGVGIMNIMYVSVAERTFEIGLRKALGAEPRDILWQFLSESIMVTFAGGLIGIIIGALLAFVIYLVAFHFGFRWVYSISLASVLLSVFFSAGIGLIFGLYPARKAALLNPIDALRRE